MPKTLRESACRGAWYDSWQSKRDSDFVRTDGEIEGQIMTIPTLSRLERIEDLRAAWISEPDDRKWSSVKLASFTNDELLTRFLEVIGWAVHEVEAAHYETSV